MKILKPIAHSKLPTRAGGNGRGKHSPIRAVYDNILTSLAKLSAQRYLPIDCTDGAECTRIYHALRNRGAYPVRRGLTLYVQGHKES